MAVNAHTGDPCTMETCVVVQAGQRWASTAAPRVMQSNKGAQRTEDAVPRERRQDAEGAGHAEEHGVVLGLLQAVVLHVSLNV